ncbi:TPA: FAD-dependent oxidoreductase [Pseudomonas aeruginosa]
MKQRILIVGAGFAGMWSALSAVRQLDRQGRDDVEVAVLAPQPELRIRPRFYEPDVQRMAAPLGELFAAVGVRFVQGSAQRIDVAGKRVEYRDAEGTLAQLDYDRLVLAAGSGVWRPASVAGIDAAFDVDQLEDALRLEAHLHALRDLPDSPARNTVVVAGGGFTGIETATEMPARLHVDRNLKVLGLDDVYATGDVARAATDDLGNHALMTCQHAIALGRSAGNNVAADLLGVEPIPYSQVKYVTCLDLGGWGAVFTEGWDRQVRFVREEGKKIKTEINGVWIYPPAADRAVALAAADPLIPVVA